jgi:hypothetical protein
MSKMPRTPNTNRAAMEKDLIGAAKCDRRLRPSQPHAFLSFRFKLGASDNFEGGSPESPSISFFIKSAFHWLQSISDICSNFARKNWLSKNRPTNSFRKATSDKAEHHNNRRHLDIYLVSEKRDRVFICIHKQTAAQTRAVTIRMLPATWDNRARA